MKTKLLSAGILGFGLIVSATIVASGAFAQAEDDAISYPVAELGGCEDKAACKAYCDDADHLEACLAFAEKNGLMSKGEIDTAKKFMEAGGKGPGGCSGKDECQNYCDDIGHIDECIAFAEKTGILPPEELAEAKLVQSAIARGIQPPACRGKEACDAYCEDPGNMKECVAFGEASGFLKGRELEDAKKMLTAIESGVAPLPCRGRESCDAYCSEVDHMEACMTFAQAAGFMTPEEAENSEKMMTALKKGVKPPACRGKEECDAYCAEPAHAEECIQFAVAAGFMTEEDVQRMEEGKKQFGESTQGIPPEVEACLKAALGDDAFEKMQSGQAMPPRDAEEKMSVCFSQRGSPPEDRQGPPEGGRDGEGGERMLPPQGEWREPDTQFMQRIEPGQVPPEGQRPPDGQQFAPGTYPNQPPPGEGTSGTYEYQPQEFVPRTEPAPVTPPAEPIEPTAPQSFNLDLNSSLAAIITAFKKLGF